MSTFDGILLEIQGIQVDCFENTEAECFFLSHCHTDHMRGLAELTTMAPIYMTSVSSLIISRKYPRFQANIKVLEIEIATSVKLTNKSFVVTALSAGHCAGSCMILFQIEGQDILYTGDFRISLLNLEKFQHLREVRDNEQLSIYLDSTFLKKPFTKFPKQSESVETILKMVGNFLCTSKYHKGKTLNTFLCSLIVIFSFILKFTLKFQPDMDTNICY